MPQIAPLVAGDPVRLGPFTLTGRIGEGGQGTVYLGHNAAGERAAVKLLHVKFSGDAAARSRFARELKASERVASFCTARVISADLDGDTPYIASEYIEGRSLRELVEAEGPIRGAALDRLAIGTATALTAIHRASIVHRDFKPDNVLIAADGPRVVDFGIARIIDSTGTITSRAIGTPAYMAPEQVSGDSVGPYTDIFSWASTMLFAATGQVAFQGGSIAVVLNRILNHDVDVEMLHEPLRGVVRACLSKSPGDRPSADQILLRLLGHSEVGGASPDVLNEGAQAANPGQARAAVAAPPAYDPGYPPPTRRQPRLQSQPMPQTGFRASPPPPPSPPLPPASAEQSTPNTGFTFGAPVVSPAPPSWEQKSTLPLSEAGTEVGHDGRPRRSRRFAVGAVVAALLAAGGLVAYTQLQGGSGGGGQEPKVTDKPVVRGDASGSLVDRVQRTKKIVIGVKGDLPGIGLASLDKKVFTGFEVEFARHIARELGVPDDGVSFVQVGKANRVKALTDGKVDMVLATWAINQDDAKRVDFVGPYYVAHTGVMVKSGDPYDRIADLKGKRLCAPNGSASIRVVQRAVEMTVKAASNYADCMTLINDGEVDAIPGEDVILAGFGNRNDIAMKVLPDRLDNQRYAVGVKRGDTRACQAIRGAITSLYASQTAARILTEHFAKVTFTPATAAPSLASC
ncbi:serine/threonine-protein kinase [Thermopolyspora sp. NPDC052614]|uniref:serine/threonine-protein kinase n=1 Tax=Thermopolyspora sp. NPDC052614 TaxID=3155682 RepID=UPI003426818E